MPNTDVQPLPRIASAAEWRAARLDLLAQEKELTRHADAVNTARRELPMVELDEDHVLEGPAGPARLAEVFDGRRQLIVYHFMFDPDWDEGCPSCSFLTDNIGHLAHLHARDTSLALVSRAPLEKLEAYRERMGWTVPWYSSYGSTFNYDFHTTLDPAVAPVEYNFDDDPALGASLEGRSMEGHGVSAFLREGDRVFHTYSAYGRGVEPLLGTYHYLDLTALGRQEGWELPAGRGEGGGMGWLRRHDEYDVSG